MYSWLESHTLATMWREKEERNQNPQERSFGLLPPVPFTDKAYHCDILQRRMFTGSTCNITKQRRVYFELRGNKLVTGIVTVEFIV